MVVETKRESIVGKEAEALSKTELSFLSDFRKACEDIQEKNDFTKLDALGPRADQMKKAGTLQKLRPFIDKIVANTPSTMLIPSGQNHKEVHGEIRFGEIHAVIDEEYVSS